MYWCKSDTIIDKSNSYSSKRRDKDKAIMKTKNESAEVGILVARFQVPELHSEHKKIIQRVIDTHPRVFIFLGLSPCKCTYNNPLDFGTRKAMIEESFPNVEVFYIEDMSDDSAWSSELDKQISRHLGPSQKALLYGSRDSFIPHYSGRWPTVELIPDVIVSGSEIRKMIGIKSKNSAAFRAGVIWAMENQFPSTKTTVDMVIVDVNAERVLLGRKPHETLHRFIGGFSEPKSLSFEEDAKREVMEETGLACDDFKYIGSTYIDDWRYRGERDKIKTLFFMATYIFGSPKASDDIAEVRWFSFEELLKSDAELRLVATHRPLLKMLQQKFLIDNQKAGEVYS
jgi:bifunctional NMN adenylyltransferase/nudix hydrolase